jgi:cyclopropane fatty-acyl-phospholipid synthase-like methyltransferase
MSSEIIKNNIFKYNFIKKFIKGKIFDHQQNTFTTYTSAQILLGDNISEIYSSNNLISKEKNLRKYDKKLQIDFSIKIIENCENYFDSIISFEVLTKENYLENLNNYFKFLKDEGLLIISVLNNKNKKTDIDKFSLHELKEIIYPKFEILDIYSQRFIEKPSIKENKNNLNIRKRLSNILKKIDKNRQFYIKYLQKNISKIDSMNGELKKIQDKDYVPIKYNERKDSTYLILICKKNSMSKF